MHDFDLTLPVSVLRGLSGTGISSPTFPLAPALGLLAVDENVFSSNFTFLKLYRAPLKRHYTTTI